MKKIILGIVAAVALSVAGTAAVAHDGHGGGRNQNNNIHLASHGHRGGFSHPGYGHHGYSHHHRHSSYRYGGHPIHRGGYGYGVPVYGGPVYYAPPVYAPPVYGPIIYQQPGFSIYGRNFGLNFGF